MRTILTALLINLSAHSAAGKPPLSTDEAMDICKRGRVNWVSLCTGFMQAAADYATLTNAACIPENTTKSELVKLFKANGAAQPADQPALISAFTIISTEFPCED
jgi:hypothetical protein